jgi:hypothetical protein
MTSCDYKHQEEKENLLAGTDVDNFKRKTGIALRLFEKVFV